MPESGTPIDPPAVKALAVKNGRILLVGDDQAVRGVSGTSTKVIDLRGRTVTPGLIDAHCHLSACGLLGTAYVDVSWPAVFTIAQMQAKVAEWIAKTPAGKWVAGAGWVTFEGRNPTNWKPKDLNDAVRAFHDAGYQVAIHTGGDAAVDMALDAIEAAMKANPRRDPRHRIEHSVLNSPKALQREKDLGSVLTRPRCRGGTP